MTNKPISSSEQTNWKRWYLLVFAFLVLQIAFYYYLSLILQ